MLIVLFAGTDHGSVIVYRWPLRQSTEVNTVTKGGGGLSSISDITTANDALLAELPLHTSSVTGIFTSPDGERLYTTSTDGSMLVTLLTEDLRPRFDDNKALRKPMLMGIGTVAIHPTLYRC
jgi:DNA-binding beta-propeller fold protein YncE